MAKLSKELNDLGLETVRLLYGLSKSKKPDALWVDLETVKSIRNPDVLSMQGTIFRNGGSTNKGKAVLYCEVTPELLSILRFAFKTGD